MSKIDVIDIENLNVDVFMDKYVNTGKPLVVKNVTSQWKAMDAFNFKFFQNLYRSLENNLVYDIRHCHFYQYARIHYFDNLQVIFSLTFESNYHRK